MADVFKIERHDTADKHFGIMGGDSITLEVDYDDVDHKEVDRWVDKIVRILNKHWSDDLFIHGEASDAVFAAKIARQRITTYTVQVRGEAVKGLQKGDPVTLPGYGLAYVKSVKPIDAETSELVATSDVH